MFWLKEELVGPPPRVEGGGGQLRQLAHIARDMVTDLKNMFWLEEDLAGPPSQVEGG